jgi:hypothetical protein
MASGLGLGGVSRSPEQVNGCHVQAMPDRSENLDMDVLIELGLRVALYMVLACPMTLNRPASNKLKSMGVSGGVLFLHNAMHFWPQHFATLAADVGVNKIDGHTKPYAQM